MGLSKKHLQHRYWRWSLEAEIGHGGLVGTVLQVDENRGTKRPDRHNPTMLGMLSSLTILTLGTVELFLRSGISALLGLLAFPSMGLAGAIPFPPTALPLDFREGIPSSLRSLSAVLVWLLFGYATTEGIAGPAKTKSYFLKARTQFYILFCENKHIL